MLIQIDEVLYDAEDRLLKDDPDVKPWLEKIRNLAYDIDDMLDEFATKFVENKSPEEPCCSKRRSLTSLRTPGDVIFYFKMRSKIREMDDRFQEIMTFKKSLRLGEKDKERSAYHRLDKPHPTTQLHERDFVSREDEINDILKLLTGEEDSKNLKVIPIVGMGGVGKTALAQNIYNDARIDSYFHVKAWACVSDDFDVFAITKSILDLLDDCLSCQDKDMNWLQNKLKENLSGKKFLVVLDDVWNENNGNWITLLKPFQWGAEGSKIIVTTRHESVALLAGAPPYPLKQLPEDACMKLFASYALEDGNFNRHPHLEEIGRKIVGKCKGSPLAVKTLAGVLRGNIDRLKWEAILNTEIWDLPKDKDDILPALKLSYLHLPSNLRRCFAYCAIFPKDYTIERDELIRWWIAEGLVGVKEGKNPWNMGLEYFNELLSRSLFEKSSSDGSRFSMHDLVNDLAKVVAGATYFSSEGVESKSIQSTVSSARHASIISSNCIVSQSLEIYNKMKGLRSFISLSRPNAWQNYSYIFISKKALCDLISELKYLRVLSLQLYKISEVPDCIRNLRLLRYLNLSSTSILMLPEWIVTLYNLEALMLRRCHDLTKLPDDMKKLINLEFLDIADTPAPTPLYIGKLVGLKMLTKFVVGTKIGSRLEELKDLKNLEGELCISDLHEVQEPRDAMDANLHIKDKINRLTMRWCKDFKNPRNEKHEEEVLEILQPHKNLEDLTISYFGGLEFPSWLGSHTHVNMVCVRLHGCQSVGALPSLGQLSSLKELYIQGLNAIRTVGFEFYGTGTESPFPSLMTLGFKDMPLWRNWTHSMDSEDKRVVFPCLKHLAIRDCPKLIGSLPSRLDSLVKLDIDSCLREDALLSTTTSLPSLNELRLGSCNQGVLNKLVDLTTLTILVMEDVVDLTCLHDGFTRSLTQLKELEMEGCRKLEHLWQNRDAMQNLVCLGKLIVKECRELISFMPGEGDMEVELPSNLETIQLSGCYNLEKLPSKLHTLSSLRDLSICSCPKLVSFPEAGIPNSVTSLHVRYCEMLRSLPRGLSHHHPDEARRSSSSNHNDMTSSLQQLIIEGCDSLPASPFGEGTFLPATLKRLEIGGCKGVESLADINVDDPPLQLLQQIDIFNCNKLRSLPRGLHTLSLLTSLILYDCPALELECFPPLPPAISSFHLRECPKVKSLPHQLYRLKCLRDLVIHRCESITRFPDGGLPPQLQSLWIGECENMKQPVREWLSRLTSLEELAIYGSLGGVGEEVDPQLPLPESLLHLTIYDMRKVERLSRCFPPSLRSLSIQNCPKLRELPLGDGLSPSFEKLYIYNCTILTERFTKWIRGYGHLLREIPCVQLGDNLIY